METRDEKEAYVTHIYRRPTQTSAFGAGGAASSAESALTHLSMRSFSMRRFKFKQYYKKKDRRKQRGTTQNDFRRLGFCLPKALLGFFFQPSGFKKFYTFHESLHRNPQEKHTAIF